MQKTKRIILGIDPGTQVMGYSLIAVDRSKMELLEMSILKLNARLDNYERLRQIHLKITEIIDRHQPQCFAIEAPFFGKNVQSMLKLGRAQGVAIAAAMQAGLEVFEYSPKKIKQAITGNGNAGKDQVWKMLQQLMKLAEFELRYLDASDALAVAVCHHFQESSPLTGPGSGPVKGGKKSGWDDFVRNHPHRIAAR